MSEHKIIDMICIFLNVFLIVIVTVGAGVIGYIVSEENFSSAILFSAAAAIGLAMGKFGNRITFVTAVIAAVSYVFYRNFALPHVAFAGVWVASAYWGSGIFPEKESMVDMSKIDKKEAVEQNRQEAGLTPCPLCNLMIKPEAISCGYCGSDLSKEKGT